MKAVWFVIIERLFKDRDRLVSLVEYAIDYLHDLLAKKVDQSKGP